MKKKKISSKHPFHIIRARQPIVALFIVAAVVGVGVYLYSAGHASTPYVSSEAETGTLSAPASLENDPTASGGKYVAFSKPNVATESCQLSQATGATSTKVFPTQAVPNTGADETSAIQTAINAAYTGGGGVVKLLAWTYTIDGHIVMKSNVELQGIGAASVIKAGSEFLSSPDSDGGYPVIATDGASNVTIADLTADQSGDTLDGNSVSTRLKQYLIDDRGSTNSIISGVTTINPFTYSIVAISSTKFCIEHSATSVSSNGRYNQLDGIHVTDSSFGDVIDNTVNQRENSSPDGDDSLVVQTLSGQSVHDVEFAGNTATGGYNGADFQFAESGTTDSEYNIYLYNNTLFNGVEGIHTGCYSDCGTFSNIVIGGSAANANEIYNNLSGINPHQPGDALNMAGAVTNTTFSNNTVCDNGKITNGSYTNKISLPLGNGNVIADNSIPVSCP